MSVLCGNCKKYHKTARQVRACYRNGRTFGSLIRRNPQKPNNESGAASTEKPVSKPPKGNPSPPKSKKNNKRPKYPKKKRKRGSDPPSSSDSTVDPSRSSSKGWYQMPRGRASYHSGEKCKWCGGPLGQCPCD
jgi:hypothetical protein